METILQVRQTCLVLPPGRGGSLIDRKQNCKSHIIHSIWPCPKLAILFRLTERIVELLGDSCRFCVTRVAPQSCSPKPRTKEACGRAIGTKSRVLHQDIRFLHCCPPPGPELLFPLCGEGETLVREGGLVQCWRTRNSYLWLVRMLLIYPYVFIY